MKKLSYVLIFIISLFFIGNVLALPDSFMTTHSGTLKVAMINGTLTTTENAACSGTDAAYPCFLKKSSTEGDVICVSGLSVQPPGKDVGFVLFEKAGADVPKTGEWTAKQKKGVAYIINTIAGEGGSKTLSLEQYYWLEILVNDYLDTYNPASHSGVVAKANQSILNTGKTYNQILNEANEYANQNFAPTLEASSTNLTFTKGNDGYYTSTITLNFNQGFNATVSFGNVSNSKFTYTNTGNRFTFKIKEEDIEAGGTESFTLLIDAQGGEYYEAGQYRRNYHELGIQDLTLTQVTKKRTEDKSLTITGSVSRAAISIKIGKKDSNKKFVSGATLMFQTKEQYDSKIDGITITTKNEYFEVLDIQAGTYYLTELEAPKGYDKTDKVYQIVVASDGSIKVDGKAVTSNEIDVTNDLTETVISKVSVVTNKELPGATLQILNDKKEKMSCVILDENGKKQTLKECSWVSGEKPIEVVGLAKGKYYLVETIAPKGYVLNETAVEFEVKADGTTTNVVMKNDLEVEVPDTLSSRSALLLAIAMFDIALGIGIVTYVKKNKIEE